MVIDADELMDDLFIWLAVWAVTAVMVLVVSALLLARFVHGAVTPRAVGLGFVITVSSAIVAVVAWRLVGGEMTGWDGLWGLGALAVDALACHALFRSRRRRQLTVPALDSTLVE